jgi:hypothetical protein
MKLGVLQSKCEFHMMLAINKATDLLFFVTYNQRVFCEVGTEFHNSERLVKNLRIKNRTAALSTFQQT